ERALFRRLSVFAGGFDLEAAEAVTAGDGIGATDVLDLLTQLVDRSLVVPEDRAGEARYRLLEPVRQYARDWLEASGEAEAVSRQHAEYFLRLVEQETPHPWGAPDQRAWLRRLRRDGDNLRAALAWAEERQEGELGLRLGAALWLFW